MILFIFFASPPPKRRRHKNDPSKAKKKEHFASNCPPNGDVAKTIPQKPKKKSTSHRTALQTATSQKRSLKSQKKEHFASNCPPNGDVAKTIPQKPKKKSTSHLKCSLNTEDRNRTDTRSPSPDFESGASTSSATPAQNAFRNKEHFAFEVLFEYRGSESNRYEVALARF